MMSLGCFVVLEAARHELEASGRGSLHGHWQTWGMSLTMQSALNNLQISPAQMVAGEEAAKEERRR